MKDLLLPVLLGQTRLHTRQPLGPVLFEEAHLFGVGLLEEGQRRSHAPHLVVLAELGVQTAQRLECRHHVLGIRGPCDEQAVFADRLVEALGSLHLVQLGQDLVTRQIVGLKPHTHLERLGGFAVHLQARAIDFAQALPQG